MSSSASAPIGFAGLSHLGIIYSLAAAAHGFEVIGFDPSVDICSNLAAGRLPIREPGLDELLRKHGGRVHYTANLDEVAGCGLTFFSLDVSTDDRNQSDISPIQSLIEDVASRARPQSTLAVLSQVPPGFCRRLQHELARGRPAAQLQLFYEVETLVFGNAVERALHPERYIVGCADPEAALPEAYARFLSSFDCPLLRMRYESAELAKIAINCFLVSSVSTTNMLAEVCEKIGAEWSEIAPALRLDRRIGPHAYLSPGLGIAGGNLERDLVSVAKLGAEYGTDTRLVAAWQQSSAYRADWVLRLLYKRGILRDPQSFVAIWGLAYKPETHSTKNSPALALVEALSAIELRAYDPAVMLNPDGKHRVRQCPSALEAARGADALVIMTPWKEFARVPLAEVKQAMQGTELFDPYGVLDADCCHQLGFRYHCLGSGRGPGC